MTRDEYSLLFHELGLNRVAFLRLMDCDEAVLKLVNAAIEKEREACVKAVETLMTPGHDDNNKWFNNGVLLSTVKIKERGQ